MNDEDFLQISCRKIVNVVDYSVFIDFFYRFNTMILLYYCKGAI